MERDRFFGIALAQNDLIRYFFLSFSVLYEKEQFL